MEPFLQQIQDALQNEQQGLIGGDFNAKARLWYNAQEDERGEVMEQFLLDTNLQVENTAQPYTTFSTINGESNIDLTLITNNLPTNTENWRVHDKLVESDHNMITFDVVSHDSHYEPPKIAHNISHVDFAALQEGTHALVTTLENMLWHPTCEHIDERVTLLTQGLSDLRHQIHPIRKIYPAKPVWWSDDLERKRLDLQAARRLVKCQRDQREREIYMTNYNNKQTVFKEAVKKAQAKSWRQFVEKRDISRNITNLSILLKCSL